MEEPNFRAILATRGLPVKTLVSVRNDPNKEYAGKIGQFVGKVLLPMADGCVFQTSDAQKWFPERLQKKSRIIYNAVKEEFYQVERTPVRGEIVTCGRLTEQKNHKLLIDAFAEVQKIYPFATLKIYGEGVLREKLQNQIESLNLNEKVFLMGATNDVAKALQTADLFVLSSDYEGMPNALMEAMAAGVPCISTDCPCGGPRELFGEDASDKLVPCNNSAQLSEAICKVLETTKDGMTEKRHAETFKPDRVNQMWKDYVHDIICLSR
jgi:glycosyltransferase protein